MASSVATGKSVPENEQQHMLKRKQVLNDNGE